MRTGEPQTGATVKLVRRIVMEGMLEEFFQSNWSWITIGAIFLSMLSLHMLGMDHSGRTNSRGSGPPGLPTATEEKRRRR